MNLEASIRVARGDLRLEVDLAVAAGETVAVLGPNGAGKSTLLQAIAGLVPLDAGWVRVGGAALDDPAAGVFVPAERRSIGVVFQDLLLFPHLSALDNVAFGLRARGAGRAEARRVARAWLERLGVAARAASRPGQLSGGEAQRVALARALAIDPQVLLLDEPLSALDAEVRGGLRRELRRDLSRHGGAHVVVTHDPVEAMALADRLVIVERGRVVQSGTAAEIAARPRSSYVATLAGVNLFHGEADGHGVALREGGAVVLAEPCRGEVLVVVHPRAVALYRDPPAGTPRNVWRGEVAGLDDEGDRVRVWLRGAPPIAAEVTPAAVAELGLVEGCWVWIAVKATEIAAFPA